MPPDLYRAPGWWWVCILLLAIPIAIHNTHLTPGLPLIAGGIAAVALALARWRLAGSGRAYHWGQDVFLLYLFWLVVCTLDTLDVFLSQRALASYAGSAVFVLALRGCIRDGRDWRRCAHLYVALACLISLAAWPEAIWQAVESGRFRYVSGVFVNRDLFSVIPLLGLAVASALLKETSVFLWRALVGQMVVLAATVIATGCRGAILGLALGAACCVFMLLQRRRSSGEVAAMWGALLVTVFGLVLLGRLQLPGLQRIVRSFTTDIVKQESQRLALWQDGSKGIFLNPITGSGPATFGMVYQRVRAPGFEDHFDLAHNDFVETAVETGIVGLALWLAVWFSAALRIRDCYRDRSRSFEACGMAMAVLAAAIFSIFNFIISKLPTLWWEMAMLGLVWSLPPKVESREPPASRCVGAVLIFLLGAWTVVFGVRCLVSEGYRAQASRSIELLDLEAAAALMETATRWQPERTLVRQQAAENYRKLALFTGSATYLDKARSHLEGSLASSPENLAVYLQLADLEATNHHPDRALTWLDKASGIAAGSALVVQRRAALAVQAGDFAAAVRILEAPWTSRRRSSILAELMVAAEVSRPGSLERHSEALRQAPEDFPEILAQAVRRAQERKMWQPALGLLALQAKLRPDDFCVGLQRAAALGALTGEAAEYAALSELVTNVPPPGQPPCLDQLLVRWSILARKAGALEVADKRLALHLEGNPSDTLVRAELARLLLQKGSVADAISLARVGLANNSEAVQLNMALAEIYESIGSKQLAVSYYQEVRRIDPANREAVARLRALKSITSR